jgi:hypothetical protein
MNSSVPHAISTIDQLDTESNFLMGLIGGGIAMLAAAAVWGAVTYFAEYQISWMAIGVGFLVGIAVRTLGKGRTPLFGFSGAALALLGCMLGNYIFYAGVIARQESVSFLEVFTYFIFSPADMLDLFIAAFDFMDLLFYGLAAYVGYATALDVKRRP